MKSPRSFNLWRALGSAAAILTLIEQPALAAGFDGPPVPPVDEMTRSIGVFRIAVAPAFQAAMKTSASLYYPGYDPATKRLTSPVLYDSNTVVGRSVAHAANTVSAGGVPVGSPSVTIAPSDFTSVPAVFQAATAATREIYTAIRSFNLRTDMRSCGEQGTAGDPRVPPVFMFPDNTSLVRAGDVLTGVKSPGQVQSANPGTGAANDFAPNPARSFFDIFVQVDLPVVGTFTGMALRNDIPLLIENSEVTQLPPQVVYIHGGTTAVPVKFRSAGSANGVSWNVGDTFGHLVLAGHGVSFSCDQASVNNLLDKVLGPIGSPRAELPLPNPIPTVSEWGLIILALLLLTGGTLVLQRRRTALAA